MNYDIKDVIEFIRYLYKTEEEENSSFYDIIYNEEVIIELITDLKKNSLKLKLSMNNNYHEIKTQYRKKKNHEYTTLNVLG